MKHVAIQDYQGVVVIGVLNGFHPLGGNSKYPQSRMRNQNGGAHMLLAVRQALG